LTHLDSKDVHDTRAGPPLPVYRSKPSADILSSWGFEGSPSIGHFDSSREVGTEILRLIISVISDLFVNSKLTQAVLPPIHFE